MKNLQILTQINPNLSHLLIPSFTHSLPHLLPVCTLQRGVQGFCVWVLSPSTIDHLQSFYSHLCFFLQSFWLDICGLVCVGISCLSFLVGLCWYGRLKKLLFIFFFVFFLFLVVEIHELRFLGHQLRYKIFELIWLNFMSCSLSSVFFFLVVISMKYKLDWNFLCPVLF